MMDSRLFSVVLLALASNLDNVGVGIAYGIRKTRMPFVSNLLIAAITAAGTLVAMLFGSTVGRLLNQSVAGLLAGSVLIAMGCWVIVKEARTLYVRGVRPASVPGDASRKGNYLARVHTIQENPLTADADLSGRIDPREAILLALALTPNNMVNGAAAGMMQLSLAVTVALVLVISLGTIWGGIKAGEQCGKLWLGDLAGMVSGALLVFVGTCEIVI